MSVIFRPLIMIGEDAYDHIFEEAKHVLTVHAKYGNDHLQKELAEAGNDNSKNQSTVKADETAYVHVFTKQDAAIEIQTISPAVYNELLPPTLSNVYLLIPLQPPKV